MSEVEWEYTHVKCLENDKDDIETYCVKGEVYELYYYDEEENFAEVICKQNSENEPLLTLEISMDDPDFLFMKLEDWG